MTFRLVQGLTTLSLVIVVGWGLVTATSVRAQDQTPTAATGAGEAVATEATDAVDTAEEEASEAVQAVDDDDDGFDDWGLLGLLGLLGLAGLLRRPARAVVVEETPRRTLP
jgi:MYXO-CTERM domain-containing protein